RAELLDTGAVHVARVQISHLALRASRLRLRGARLLEELMQRVAAVLAQLLERAPAGRVRRNLRGLEPSAVHVPVEIILRTNGVIEVRGIDAARELLSGGTEREATHQCKCDDGRRE